MPRQMGSRFNTGTPWAWAAKIPLNKRIVEKRLSALSDDAWSPPSAHPQLSDRCENLLTCASYVGTAARKPLRRDIYNAALAPCGLRVSELCDLQWSSIAFETGTMTCVAPRAARRQRKFVHHPHS